MNNRGMMTSLLTIGAAGAAIYGITKGVQNGTFQKLPQQMTSAMQNVMNNQTVQQFAEPIQDMMNMNNQNSGGQAQPQGIPTSIQQVVGNSEQG
ncbi:hypothetical protein [Oceanobacillus bengalensis]|uniref:Uncharacterized protein n=1 Tax=Oceanobacillus bengalensis TaxID=1435466 RepID=A0A494YS30_9BACI|nr:hypothetical protein [Oceanobacillus bengalensis]RKQ12445.1 hypothetical protein D8M05_18075 [Oceanobacillus bengalensis]